MPPRGSRAFSTSLSLLVAEVPFAMETFAFAEAWAEALLVVVSTNRPVVGDCENFSSCVYPAAAPMAATAAATAIFMNPLLVIFASMDSPS